MFSRKMVSALLAMTLAVGLSVPAFAANGYVTNNNSSGGTKGWSSSSSSSTEKVDGDRTGYVPSTSTATSTGSLSATNATSAVSTAVSSAVNGKASATVRNVAQVTSSVLNSMFNTADNSNVDLTVNFDTVVNNAVVGRISITKSAAANLPATMNVGVSNTQGAVAELFNRHFTNNVVTVNLAQTGSLGATVEVAVKLNLSGLDVNSLVFYSYDRITNSYNVIPSTSYYVDSNGYLHFNTSVGGDIVVTDSALARK